MKKLLSICLTVVMMVCLLAGMTVNATDVVAGDATISTMSTPSYEYFTLRRENFGIEYENRTQQSEIGWGTTRIGGHMQQAGCPKLKPSSPDYSYGTVASAVTANFTITANVYIDTPGTYTAFMNVEQSNKGIKFAIDGQETTTPFSKTEQLSGLSSAPYYFKIEKADRTWNLTQGWHTITVTATKNGAKFQMIFLTNDTALTSEGLTHDKNSANAVVDSKVNMSVYEDFTAPTAGTLTVTPDANAENNHVTSATLTWSGASDANGIVKYEIHNGTDWVDVTNEASYTVNDLWAATEYTFKLRVADAYGSTAETTSTATTNGPADTDGPTWTGTEVSVANASFSSTITFPAATDNRGMAAYDIYENSVADENLLATVEHDDPDATTYSALVSLEPNETKDVVVVARDLFGLLSTELSATIASQAGTENFTLREGNFDVANGFSLNNISSSMISLGCTPLNLGTRTNQATSGQLLRGASRGGTTTAEIYVDTPGEYTLFAQVQSGYKVKASLGGGAFSGYLANIPVTDDSNNKLYVWTKADRVWYLEEGWNTVKLQAEDAAYVTVVFVTNSINMEPDEITYAKADSTVVVDGKLNIGCYEDTELPIYAAGDITVAYDTTINEATITWPAATDMDYTRPSPEYTMPASGLKSYKVYVNNKELAEVDNATTSFVLNETTLGRALVPGETLSIKVDAIDMYGNASPKALSYEVSKFAISNFAVAGNAVTLTIKNISEASADIRLAIAIYDDATGDLVAGDCIVHTVDADGIDDTVTASITSGAPADMTGYTLKAHLWNADLSPVSANWPTIVQ